MAAQIVKPGGAMASDRCQVCLEVMKEDFTLSACGHTFCKPCLQTYVTLRVKAGGELLECFFGANETKKCGVQLTERDIMALVDEPTQNKYHRFKRQRDDPNVRYCPRCEAPGVGRASSPAMVCLSCRKSFCFLHDDAHPHGTCADYEAANRHETKLSDATIAATTKRCPGCGSAVEKSGGCNQMRCGRCSTHFCWVCGARVDAGTFPTHFAWYNVAGCPNQQLQEGIAPPSRTARRCMRLLAGLQLIVVGPFAVAMTIASTLVCCPCTFAMASAMELSPLRCFTDCVSTWGYVFLFLIVSPVLLLDLLIGALARFLNAVVSATGRVCGKAARERSLRTLATASGAATARAPASEGTPASNVGVRVTDLELQLAAAEEGIAREGITLAEN